MKPINGAGPAPSMIETVAGQVPVAGTHSLANQAVYEDEEKALAAMRKAMEGCIAVCKRYGMHGLVVVGARHTDARKSIITANVHGDGQFVGIAMDRLSSLPGWEEAATAERLDRERAEGGAAS